MEIRLVCGDPADKKPATFTRFVLPFAYCPVPPEKKDETTFYYEGDKQDESKKSEIIERKKYLTYETGHVLFEKAKWLTLKNYHFDPVEVPFLDCGVKRSIKVHIKSPSLILFEWPENLESCKKHCDMAGEVGCSVDKHNALRIGFLVVELYFSNSDGLSPGLDALLRLNEIFRYWQRPYEGHEKGYIELLGNFSLELDSKETIRERKEDISAIYFERWASLLDKPQIKIGGNKWRLFPLEWMVNARNFVSGKDNAPPGWAIYSDNRAFVWTCAITENGGGDLRKRFIMPEGKAWEFGHWIRLLNVDNPGYDIYETHESRDFEKKWAEERTYKRWEEWGTFYGFNYHCGVMLGSKIEEPPICKHFKQMYFDQILLLLYIRVALFNFSMVLNRISAKALKEENVNISGWRGMFQKLRWSFALFTNLYQFPLLSNQQQAIEMYSLARKYMDIDSLFMEVKEKIDNSHEFLVAREGIEQSAKIERLTILAAIGVPISICLSFWGMSMIIEELSTRWCSGLKWIALLASLACLVGLSVLVFKRLGRHK